MKNSRPIPSLLAVLLVPIYNLIALLQFKFQWMRFKARMRKYEQRQAA